MKSKLEFEHGENTCAVEPGKFCRFFATKNFGTQAVCILFDDHLHLVDGWTHRCKKCKEEFPINSVPVNDNVPVAEIFWSNDNPEWQLNMLVEPAVFANEKINLYTK